MASVTKGLLFLGFLLSWLDLIFLDSIGSLGIKRLLYLGNLCLFWEYLLFSSQDSSAYCMRADY